MVDGIIGRKLGMSQIHDAKGRLVAVTVLQAGPCVVVQRKERGKDGYDAVQLGLVDPRGRKPNRALSGHLKPAGSPSTRLLREFRALNPGQVPDIGGTVDVNLFSEKDRVDITGQSRGIGFSGVVKRWGFRGGAASHDSMFHRAPGSIGASSYPSRVYPGARMPGRKGNRRVTMRNLPVIRVDRENHILMVRGAVPGPRKGVVLIRKSRTATVQEPGG